MKSKRSAVRIDEVYYCGCFVFAHNFMKIFLSFSPHQITSFAATAQTVTFCTHSVLFTLDTYLLFSVAVHRITKDWTVLCQGIFFIQINSAIDAKDWFWQLILMFTKSVKKWKDCKIWSDFLHSLLVLVQDFVLFRYNLIQFSPLNLLQISAVKKLCTP